MEKPTLKSPSSFYYPWEVDIITVDNKRIAILKTADQRRAEYVKRGLLYKDNAGVAQR